MRASSGDDGKAIIKNPAVVGAGGLKAIWTTSAADICPLTITTFWLEACVVGIGAASLSPRQRRVARRLRRCCSGGCGAACWCPARWLAAALWALHPVQVESVAWVVELKNTQSAFFFLLTVSLLRPLAPIGRRSELWLDAALRRPRDGQQVLHCHPARCALPAGLVDRGPLAVAQCPFASPPFLFSRLLLPRFRSGPRKLPSLLVAHRTAPGYRGWRTSATPSGSIWGNCCGLILS